MTRKEWEAAMRELSQEQRRADADRMATQVLLNHRYDELISYVGLLTEELPCLEKKSPSGS